MIYVDLPDVWSDTHATLWLRVVTQGPLPRPLVPMNHVAYDVEPYYVANGLPVADTALGIEVGVDYDLGDMTSEAAYGRPWDTDTGATSRWLPLPGTFDDGQTWTPVSGSEPLSLSASGTDPELDLDYEYVRGTDLVGGTALRLDAGDFLITDGARWAADSVSVAMVAVLHAPRVTSYGLLETYSDRPGQATVSLRYAADGVVQTTCLGLLSGRQTSNAAVRDGQPVIIAFTLSAPDRLEVVLVDRTVSRWSTRLGGMHPYDARLYVGTAPSSDALSGAASIDILELDYWLGLGPDELLEKVSLLDGLYGVTVS